MPPSVRSGRLARTRSVSSLLPPAVLTVPPPPLIRWRLRPPLGRVLPLLLPAVWRQVEQGPDAAHRLDPASVGEVGAVDVVAITENDAEPEGLAFGGRHPEVVVEVALGGGIPRYGPTHPLLIGLDIGERCAGDQGKGSVAGVQVGQMGDLVHDQRAAGAAGRRPAPDTGCE